MTTIEARRILQAFYDLDKIGAGEFEDKYYPALLDESATYWRARDCHTLAARPEDHISIYLAERAREALAWMLLVETPNNT